jgi:hypothetical protein
MGHIQEPGRHIPPEVARYAEEIVSRLQALLGEDLLSTYLIGSVALGGL